MIARLTAWLAGFVAQPDKLLHFLVLLALVYVLRAAGVPELLALWIGAGLCWAKERYDRARPAIHTWDGWDAFAGMVGALAGCQAWRWIAPHWAVG